MTNKKRDIWIRLGLMLLLLSANLVILAQDDDYEYDEYYYEDDYDDTDEFDDSDFDGGEYEYYDDSDFDGDEYEYYEYEYIECETEEECAALFEDEYGDFIEFEDFDDNFVGGDEEFASENVDGRFEVNNGVLVGDPTPEQQALWNAFTSLIPARWVNTISAFEVISDPETSGYVYPDENDPSKFVLGLNSIELNEPEELNHTIIHEFAHILTLNPNQVDGVLELGNSGSCPTLALDEGCTDAESYINQFNSQFESQADGNIDTNFVSEYASSNIAEDIAESFTAFVLRDRSQGNAVADQKINFFYNFPALVQIRQQIRANIANQ